MLGNKKGVSPVIAVVLMIVVAVAISLVVYVWATGFVSEKTGTETKAGDYSFLVETRDIDNVNIRNTGTDISFASADAAGFIGEFDIYIDNVLQANATAADIDITTADTTWSKGEVLTIDFDATGDGGTIGGAVGDKIKLVHKDSGTPIVFKLE